MARRSGSQPTAATGLRPDKSLLLQALYGASAGDTLACEA
jgi:hypothetical protein